MRRLDTLGGGDWGEAPGPQDTSRRINKAQRLNVEPDKRAARRRLHLREISDGAAHKSERVGSDLKATRVGLGYDLSAVAEALRIRRDHLEAVEESNLAALPGKAYAIGFVRSYADYLGLDAEECVRRFKEETKQVPVHGEFVFLEANEEIRLPHGVMAIVLFLLAVGAVWGITRLTDWGGQGRATVTAVPPEFAEAVAPRDLTDVASANGVESALVAATSGAEAPALEPVDETAPILSPDPLTQAVFASLPEDYSGAWPRPKPPLDGAGAAAAAPAAEAPVAGRVFGAQNTDAQVVIRARKEAWLRVEDLSAGVLFEETLAPGDQFRVPNRPGIVMAVRDAGAVEIIVNDVSLGPAGPEGRALPALLLDKNVLASRTP
ncbi:MAG: helix-turn-helix domain-containing protein [Alphaproteobacteria bacterium]|nr:helix-turn-helix domain-containing protein [Alphaproteobacteria bacterium]